jgi:Mrp family chromosome partitioning ATPase
MSDAVVLVIRSGKTTRDTALAAKERLRQDGTRVLGTILNQWNPKKTTGGYGYRYYYEKYYRGSYYKT